MMQAHRLSSGALFMQFIQHSSRSLCLALLVQSTVVSSEWERKEPAKDAGHGVDYAVHAVVKTAAGAVEAFDAGTGKLKWSLPSPAQGMVAADGVLVVAHMKAKGIPPGKYQPRCTLSAPPAVHAITQALNLQPGPMPRRPPGGPYVLIWRTGKHRHSDVYLAIVSPAPFETGRGTRFFTG